MPGSSAEFLKFVRPSETRDELVAEAKQLTWEHFREHAVLKLEDGRRILVRGTEYSIDLEISAANDPFGRPAGQLYVEIALDQLRVVSLVFHTHPKPTGPSDADLQILDILKQDRSMLYELFGPLEGTEIRPKQR